MLFTTELVFSEKIKVGISLVIVLTVEAFKGMGVGFTLLSFQFRRIRLAVTFAILYEVLVVFRFMWAITFDTF